MKIDKLSLKTNILKEMFNIAPKKYKVNESDTLVLAKKFQVSKEELNNSLEFLFEIHFIKKTTGPNYKQDKVFEWEITEDGLHYLEKKEVEKKQEEMNKKTNQMMMVIVIVTFIYTLVAVFNFMLFEPSEILSLKGIFFLVSCSILGFLIGWVFPSLLKILRDRKS